MSAEVSFNKKSFLFSRKLYLLILALILLLLFIGLYFFISYKVIPIRFFVLKNNPNTDLKSSLPSFNQNIAIPFKKTFSDPKYSVIITYMNLAVDENKDLNKKYDYLSKAYTKASQAYNQTKNPEFKKALILLNQYLKSFPQYNQAKLPLPN